jgi:aspartate dehydrogenase
MGQAKQDARVNNTREKALRTAIAGLGTVGLEIARRIDAGEVPGLAVTAVSARDTSKAADNIARFKTLPAIVAIENVADAADIVVECAPPSLFETIASRAVALGRIFVPLSLGGLLDHMELIDQARETGARIIIPTGALLGLDAVRAAAEGEIRSVTMITRKPPDSLAGAPLVTEKNIHLEDLKAPLLLFEGSARDAIRGFPANVNVAVALSLAGTGPDKTRIEIWADPAIERNTHTIHVEADSANFTMTIENIRTAENPRTGRITALSTLAALRRLTAPLTVGS